MAHSIPLAANRVYPVEPMSQMVLVAVITDGAEVIVGALGTLPPYAENGLLPASVTHCPVVPGSGRGRIPYPKIVGSGAPVVGCSAIVPNNDDFFRRLEIAHGADVALAPILWTERGIIAVGGKLRVNHDDGSVIGTDLLPPLPVDASDDTSSDTFHHQSSCSRR